MCIRDRLTTYMSSQYGIDLSKKKILAECRMNGELEKRGNISVSYTHLAQPDCSRGSSYKQGGRESKAAHSLFYRSRIWS